MMQAANSNADTLATHDFVTVFVGETMFGLAIDRVHDVFIPAASRPCRWRRSRSSACSTCADAW